MKQIGHAMAELGGAPARKLPSKSESALLPSTSRIQRGPEEMAKLVTALSVAFTAQKQFGKQPAAVRDMAESFCLILHDQPTDRMVEGILTHMRTNSEIPTPADVLRIIDPPFEPNWDVYRSIKKRVHDGALLYGTDAEYVRKCDNHVLRKAK